MPHSHSDHMAHSKKIKVLVVNKFYYRRGGDCTYTLNLEQLLRDNGHEVAVFAMQYPENISSAYSGYFATEVNFGNGVIGKLKALGRTMGLGGIKRQFARLLSDFNPDVVHLNNIHSYLSPVLAAMAHSRGIKVVWTLHDYKLACPSYSCLCQGRTCEKCFTGMKTGVVQHRCMKGSLIASITAWAEAMRWNRNTLQRNTDTFICPSQFMAEAMARAGFSRDKLVTLNNFMPGHNATQQTDGTGNMGYCCYVGRLSPEKGVETLLKAAREAGIELRVAGGGPMHDELASRYGSNRITFLGMQGRDNVEQLLRGAAVSVMPSECYENNPLSVIESLCLGTPVVGARIGGIPELISPADGLLFESGNSNSLKQALLTATQTSWDRNGIAQRASLRFNPDTHYRQLVKIYG
ncbi:glycosyltransferase [uncultured Muribaculum sp.]|uniref:glycosyltransferase n=1 Tax=uncultured Muribaculum sp. TaxID=1918613 RepID=UPI0034A0AB03